MDDDKIVKSKSSITSLILLGDAKGFTSIKNKKTPEPKQSSGFFNMCCSNDSTNRNSDMNLTRIKPLRNGKSPISMTTYWNDDIIHFYIKESEFQKNRLGNVL